MSKRKPLFEVEDMLPNDEQLGERSIMWKTFMDAFLAALNRSAVVKCTRHLQAVVGQRCRFCFSVIMHSLLAFRRWLMLRERKRKLEPLPPPPETGESPPPHEADSGEPQRKYYKPNEEHVVEDDNLLDVCDQLNYAASDHSNASDVQTDAESEDDNFEKDVSRADVKNQLVRVVAKRKPIWAKSGLMELMKAVEDVSNMPSNVKVEEWLSNQHTGPFDMTQNRKTVVTERTAAGDRMRFSRKEEVTISRDADDADSLSTVDEKNYIRQNVKDRHVTSKIKVIQTFRIKTNSSANAFALRPRMHSISGFPIHEEEPMATTSSWLHKTSKSDSAFETGEDQSQNRSCEQPPRKAKPAPAAAPLPSHRESSSRRRKVFKKTVKKKSALKSPSKKGSSASSSQQYESALKHCGTVKKVATRRIHWQEAAKSSSDECDEVFPPVRTTRSKAKASSPPKRELRSKSSSRSSMTPEVSPRKLSPRKKKVYSPRKTVDRELVGTFNSICLSPRKNPAPAPAPPPKQTTSNDQTTTNLTALFSSTNDKISNSTTVGHNKTSSVSNKSIFADAAQGIVVYKPKTIRSEIDEDARIHITAKDLELAEVTKGRHLDSFQKFNYVIHPNSTVLFFPSDSEDDESFGMTNNDSDGDLSFDDDDPILTFKPRDFGRLNVMEYKYN